MKFNLQEHVQVRVAGGDCTGEGDEMHCGQTPVGPKLLC